MKGELDRISIIQGDPLKSTPPNFSKSKMLSKLAQKLSKCQKLYRDFVLKQVRGGPL